MYPFVLWTVMMRPLRSWLHFLSFRESGLWHVWMDYSLNFASSIVFAAKSSVQTTFSTKWSKWLYFAAEPLPVAEGRIIDRWNFVAERDLGLQVHRSLHFLY